MQSTTNVPPEQSPIDWQHHVDAFDQGDMSKAQYCRDNNLTYHLFIYWSTKLSGAVPGSAASSKTCTSKLVPATLATHNAQTLLQHGLQIHLPNGVHVSGIDSGNIGLVGQLIEQL